MSTQPAAQNVAPVQNAVASQEEILDEIAARHAEIAAERDGAGAGGRSSDFEPTQLDFVPYRSSLLRHPTKRLQQADPESVELLAPVFGRQDVDPLEADLTIQHRGEPIGERMIITGRVQDSAGRPVAGQLVEVWQANSAGRYIHQRDQHPAPLDPNFTGTGRCLTDADGRYRFTTIKPGPYPWLNHHNAWRPAHIHFSVFGTAFTQRLVTQMYFPGDPLFALDPIFQSIPDPDDRQRLIATYDHSVTRPQISTGYRWDIVLGGPAATWLEPEESG